VANETYLFVFNYHTKIQPVCQPVCQILSEKVISPKIAGGFSGNTLNCWLLGDFFINDKGGYLIVRHGKCDKKRLVRFNREFKEHYEDYLHWKQAGEKSVGPAGPLLLSSNTAGHMTSRTVEKALKRVAAKAGLPEYYSIHCLRHTYACQLYRIMPQPNFSGT